MTPEDPVADIMRETRDLLAEWPKPAFILFAPDDPILGSAHLFFRNLIPSADHRPTCTRIHRPNDLIHHCFTETGGSITSR
jgi:hypothetical protein